MKVRKEGFHADDKASRSISYTPLKRTFKPNVITKKHLFLRFEIC